MDRFTREEANVLTTEGFADYCLQRHALGLTIIAAYEETELMHQRVHKIGKRKYLDYVSFKRLKNLNIQAGRMVMALTHSRKADAGCAV